MNLTAEPTPAIKTYQLARAAGVTLRQLQWWDEKKIVRPVQDRHARLYGPSEVRQVKMIADLRRKGLSLQQVRKLLKFMAGALPGDVLLYRTKSPRFPKLYRDAAEAMEAALDERGPVILAMVRE